MNEIIAWIAVDWGTSNLRAWGMDGAGRPILARSSDKGMGKLKRDEFAAALGEIVADMPLAGPTDVLICGMAGARQGWLEAPYLETPVDLRGLAAACVRPEAGARLSAAILPGICQKQGANNVMRGEETQLLGLAATLPGYRGLVGMPGTHSKWARLDGSRIEQFSTAMTGELFELLKTHSVLRHSLAVPSDRPSEDPSAGRERDAGFAAGAEDGLARPDDLWGQLFRVRADSLIAGRQPAWCAGYLSGLLIGTEIAANRRYFGDAPIPLIGAPALCALYVRVLDMAGAVGRPVDATEIVLAGLTAAREAFLQ